MGMFGSDRIHGTSLRTFKAFYALVMEAVGVDILLSFPVGLELQVHNKAGSPMGAPFLGNKKIVHAKGA
jgi:hypothetical protein